MLHLYWHGIIHIRNNVKYMDEFPFITWFVVIIYSYLARPVHSFGGSSNLCEYSNDNFEFCNEHIKYECVYLAFLSRPPEKNRTVAVVG